MTNATNVPSPCVEICDLDQTGQYCLGCGRTIGEIEGWGSASDEEKLLILARLQDRKARLNTPDN